MDSARTDYRFTRQRRLTRPAEFDRVLKARMTVHTGPLRISAAPNDLGRNRMGLIVSRRAGKAVRRTRIKRMLREAFRQLAPGLPSGYDLVVAARAHDGLHLNEYQQHLVNALLRLHRRWSRAKGGGADD